VRALTKEQVVELLTAIFAVFDQNKLNALTAKLDKDVAATLSRLLTTKPSEQKQPKSKRIVSEQKYIAEWNKLWSEWDDIVTEVSNEKGKYIYQEHHWEQPYLAADDLSDALDEIAEKLLPRIERIYKSGAVEESVFADGLHDIEHAINCLPEWMGADNEGIGLGPIATQCVLKWEWLFNSRQPTAFADSIVALEEDLNLVALDGSKIFEFFTALPEKTQRQIYDHLTAKRDLPPWHNKLNTAHSTWHRLYHKFSEAFDPEAHLENCRALLHENWRYGLPVIENLLRKKDYAQAGKIMEKIFASFLKHSRENWKPEAALLIDFFYQPAEKDLGKLLKQWIVIAGKLGQAEKMAALKLQHVTYQKTHDWDAVIAVYQELKALPVATVAENLFAQWQAYIFKNSVSEGWQLSREMNESWIHWLIETGLDEAKGKKWFAQKIEAWLEHLRQNPEAFKKQRSLVYALTQDLAPGSAFKKDCPKLFEYVLRHTAETREGVAIRRAWLEKMEGTTLIPQLMECWKENIPRLVPNPAQSYSSAYEEQARWLSVVDELNPTACSAIITQWRRDHKLKKNLWRALEKHKLWVAEKKPQSLFVTK
jgi:hypothetical protein